MASSLAKLIFKPLTSSNWQDFETLFGERGACGGCWCMFWRLRRSEFERQKGAGNKAAMRNIVNSHEVPGILAYLDGEPVGWCAVAPRESYSALERSRLLKPVDDKPVWSISCFFVAKPFRRQGVSVKLLEAAVRCAGERGAQILEGYPVETTDAKMPDAFVWHGLASAFRAAGFKECARRSETRPIMRRTLRKR